MCLLVNPSLAPQKALNWSELLYMHIPIFCLASLCVRCSVQGHTISICDHSRWTRAGFARRELAAWPIFALRRRCRPSRSPKNAVIVLADLLPLARQVPPAAAQRVQPRTPDSLKRRRRPR